jgi:hypothetical protein
MGAVLIAGIAMWSGDLRPEESSNIQLWRRTMVRAQFQRDAIRRVVEREKTFDPDRARDREPCLSKLEQNLAAQRRVLASALWDTVWARCKVPRR